MLPKVIFCVAVSLAVIAVAVLALFSPLPHRNSAINSRPWLALSLYIQQPKLGGSNLQAGAVVFHRTLTEGPENTSRAMNLAQKEKKELIVVGGTGSFAFARGLAVFAQTDTGASSHLDATYHIKLHLKFPNRSQTMPG
ncbi:hypothetical protein ACH5RR_027299 [Cinchona calisaya]|uniref:Dirigent protein n=1 Tax=Cinchona calisaya TaxID=153742 RepID=A0ABD2Z8A3_9GENT